jgi:threonine/homoserine/homoserine lactone efflux protein
MPTAATLGVFIVAALALLVVPGPSVLYLVTQSIAAGRRGGMAAMLGVQTAGAVHVLFAAAGLSAIIASSATAFAILKYAGAAYLIWMGARRLLGGESIGHVAAGADSTTSQRRLFRQGFIVNLLNPKSAIFFVAVLPQFVDRTRGAPWVQVLILGAIFLTIAVISDGAWVLCAGWVSTRLRSRRAQRIESTLSGAVLIALGLVAATQRRT